jgi:transcriptional regulator with XRE-family HTH domain
MTPLQFKALRRALGVTQADVCKQAGISRQTLIWFETNAGASDKTVQKLKAWATAQGATFNKSGRLLLPK